MNEWREKKPQEWRRYVNNEVKVTAHEKQECQGWVFTVDPVSASVVLVNFQDTGRTCVTVVMGHAVEAVEILKEGGPEMEERLSSLFMPTGHHGLTKQELQHRKDSLRVWLEKNRIPVVEEGETLRVAGVLSVDPPYGPQDCSSSNEIILSRVQSLVQNNPVKM
ncbi:gem-associated protein 6 [Scleropages formosus]|uniref:Gem-associated protein 6 n=1 Tax=Scleropages formosus TaxID=113540 RepID=A0A8C9S7U4_SCLFO|nr:gem-associated protein 6 [Scleropages formosus]